MHETWVGKQCQSCGKTFYGTPSVMKKRKRCNSMCKSKKTIDKWVMISNDIAWCKKQPWSKPDIKFIDESDEVRAFWWMLNWSQGAVISNSTYSWWGAILGAHFKGSPVVYPKVWHLEHKPNLFPAKWTPL